MPVPHVQIDEFPWGTIRRQRNLIKRGCRGTDAEDSAARPIVGSQSEMTDSWQLADDTPEAPKSGTHP